jgi:hypothetical protein
MNDSLTLDWIQKKLVRRISPFSWPLALLFALGLTAAGCTKKPENPNKSRLLQKMEEAQKKLAEMELEIKTMQEDPSESSALAEDKELLLSRVERIKEQLMRMGAIESPSAASSGGGGHH